MCCHEATVHGHRGRRGKAESRPQAVVALLQASRPALSLRVAALPSYQPAPRLLVLQPALFGQPCVSDAAAAIGGHPRGVTMPVDHLNLVCTAAGAAETPTSGAQRWIGEHSLATLASTAALLDESRAVLAIAVVARLGPHAAILP